MDPISYIVSTYINLVSSSAMERTQEIYGTEIQSITVPYHGHQVSFSYQLWKIKPESVCQPKDPDMTTYSRCTLEAKNFFGELCQTLQKKPSNHWKHIKSKNMYCTAAMSYQPVIATIENAKERTAKEQAKADCNAAIAATIGSNDAEANRSMRKKCAIYKSMTE